MAVGFLCQTGRAELPHHFSKKTWRDRQVIEMIPLRLVGFFHHGNLLLEDFVAVGVLEIAADIVDALEEPAPQLRRDRATGELLYILGQLIAKGLGGEVIAGVADNGKLLRQQLGRGQVEQGRNEFSLGQISARAKDDHHARVRLAGGWLRGSVSQTFIVHDNDNNAQDGASVNCRRWK